MNLAALRARLLGRFIRTDRGQRAVGGASLYGAALIVEGVLQFAVVPLVTRAVPVAVYAQYGLILVGLPLVTMACDLGATVGVLRQVPAERDPTQRERLLSTAFWGRMATAGPVALLIALTARWVPWAWLAGPETAAAVPWLALLVLIWNAFDCLCDGLRAFEKHAAVAGALLTQGLLRASTLMLMVVALRQGLTGILISMCFGYGVGLLVCLPFSVKALRRRPQLALYRGLVAFGAPAAGSYALRAAAGLDRYVLRAAGSLSAAGLYQLASVAGTALDMGGRTLLLAVEPFVYGVASEDTAATLDRLLRWIILLLTAVCLGLSLAAPELMAILGPAEYASAAGAMPWLAFAGAARIVFRLIAFGSGIAGTTRTWLVAVAVELGCALGLTALLAPSQGATGAGVARFAAAAVGLLVCDALVRRVWSGRLPALRSALWLTGCAAVSSLLVSGSETPAPLWLRAAAWPVGVLLTAVVFGLRQTEKAAAARAPVAP